MPGRSPLVSLNQRRTSSHANNSSEGRERTKDRLEKADKLLPSLRSTCILGAILGLLLGGIVLSIVTSFWLTASSTTTLKSTSIGATTVVTTRTTATTISSITTSTSVTTTTTRSFAAPPLVATSQDTTMHKPFLYRWNATAITVAGVTQTAGTASHLLNHPLCMTVSSSNDLYIVDNFNHRVQKWRVGSTNGTTVAGQANASSGSSLSLLTYPSDVALGPGDKIYVVDLGNGRVLSWTNGSVSGTVVAGGNGVGSNSNQFSNPLGIAYDSTSDTLYIADSNNHRVMQYSSGATVGVVVAGGNGQGISSNQLSNPRGLYYDSSTNSLLIANNGGHNIVRWVIGASSWTLVTGSSSGVSGSTSTLFSYPTDVTLDSMGNMYVSDEGNQRIQFFRSGQSNGTTIAGVTGTSGSAANLLNAPSSVAVDNQFNVYAVDYNNARVQMFQHY